MTLLRSTLRSFSLGILIALGLGLLAFAAEPQFAAQQSQSQTSLSNPIPPLFTQEDSSALGLFSADLDHIRTALRVPGLSAAIVGDGKIVWRQNFGDADSDSHAPMTDATLFPVASISKTMAAVVILQLANEGKLHLDDPITRYRPDLTLPREVTIERVLSHTAEDVPGSEFLYSGAMYSNLTGVVERIEKKPYAQVLTDRIFKPVGMTNTFAGLPVGSPAAITARVAKGYELNPQTHLPQPVRIDLTRISAATGVVSTVSDLAKYAVALDSNKLLPAAATQRMTTPERSTRGATLPYALGWFAETYLGESLVWHYGQEAGYSSLFLSLPERNETLIVLANSNALSDAPRLLDGEIARSPIALAFLADVVLAADSRAAFAPTHAIDMLRDAITQRDARLESLPADTPANHAIRRLMRDALISQSRIEFYLGRADQSATLLHRVLGDFPELGLPRETATLFYLVQLNRPDLDRIAHELSRQILEIHPTLAPALYYSGIIEARAGNADQSNELFKRACNEWPRTQHSTVGASCLEAGRAYSGANEKLARLYLTRAIDAAADDDTRSEARALLANLPGAPQ